MKSLDLRADHLYNWSDTYERSLDRSPASKAQSAASQAASTGGGSSGLADHTLQTMRQVRMPLCRGTRSRPKVLPVSQPAGVPTADGLRLAGESSDCRGVLGQLSLGARASGADQQHQPRTAAPQRETLSYCRDSTRSLDTAVCRFEPGRVHGREHPRGVVANRQKSLLHSGGEQC